MAVHACKRHPIAVRAFTLIELLTVISIIILLVTILMPTLNRAREYTYSAVCRSNLHQLWDILHTPDGGSGGVTLPEAPLWLSFAKSNGGEEVIFCPKDRYETGTEADLDSLYFVQNGRTFCTYPELRQGISQDSQVRYEKTGNTITVRYVAGEYNCAMCVITLADPVKVVVPDHLSHWEATGGCASQHYVCFDADADGFDDWDTDDLVIRMKGAGYSQTGSAVIPIQGTASYAMNTHGPAVAGRSTQILLVGYEKPLADVFLGDNNQVDGWDDYMYPCLERHLGEVNAVSVQGNVFSMNRQKLDAERDLGKEGAWGPGN